ncbi:MAG TPA: hypothetical protein VH641_14375 [Streptosporangiaceae bacterium]|jgi:L-alanine-DL-glutamate epimerase-like enolase superfamily enzyme
MNQSAGGPSRCCRWRPGRNCYGTVTPLAGPGLGVEVDEEFLRAHPLTEGPAWR